MRKLIVLITISLLTFSGISQTASNKDTTITCLPNSLLRESMRLNEVRKVQEKELEAYKQRVVILDSIVAARDQFVLNSAKKDATYEKQIFAFNSAISTLKQQNQVYTDWVGDLDKQLKQSQNDLKKANRKRAANKIFYGTIAAAAIVYSIFK